MNELNYKKRFHLFKDMKFLHRMILIYLIGGIIPLLVMSIYTNMQTRKMMIKLTEETQAEELSVLSSSIRESMTVLDNVARLLCSNDEILKLTTRKYKNKTQFYSDYRKANTVMEDYINFYEQDISSINLFLDNPTVDTYDLNRINNLSYFKQSVRTQTWYKETVDCVDEGYWYFGATSGDNEKDQTMQISRAVRDDDDDVVGIVVIQIQYDKVTLNEQRQDTAVLYDDYYWISGNCSSLDYPFLKEEIQKINKSRVTKQISYGVEEYLISYERLQMDGSDDYYSVVSVQNYQDIMAEVNQISMQAFIPEIIGMIVSALLIFAFAASYSNRMFQLRVQMHRVAQGEYDEVERIEGNDEIGELYTELEQMMQDIRLLMSNVVDEQVQKEKLHTKQKEVEFKMLASQINPHFLYNTLETIRMKAVVNHQPEIVELVKMLAKTMRYNIQVTDRLVTLKEELQMVEYYLKIQEYRFGDRITSELTIDPDVDMKARILPLTLQPFVENAFVHGLEEKACDARLVIHVYKKKDDIFIEIRDNGKGMDYYELGHLRKIMKDEQGDDNHIGVRNVNQRIRLLFGGEYGVEVDSEKNVGTKVVIHIPYQTEINQNV
ncbi:MAG: sensor histidine kinase [Roseburia sp.]|nr:sensor histidine kinase [Roseburia sp.]